ncbi:unnamed protein product [Prorocentrum cordatum]|uniref:Uncharacterized protein n=1 Tax=Prorocentrum cordatum TaxID=2364126 RepID=A0ABN9SGE2_9DINO|nr:unnamed protein product [Polarella glacialis]
MADVLGRRRLWGARPRNPRGPRIFCVHGASLPPSTFPAVRGRTPQDRGGNGCCCGFPSVLNGTAVLHPVPDNARSAAHACARLHLEHVCVPSTLEFEWQGGCGPPLYWSYGGRPRCPVTPVLLLPLLLLSLLLMEGFASFRRRSHAINMSCWRSARISWIRAGAPQRRLWRGP